MVKICRSAGVRPWLGSGRFNRVVPYQHASSVTQWCAVVRWLLCKKVTLAVPVTPCMVAVAMCCVVRVVEVETLVPWVHMRGAHLLQVLMCQHGGLVLHTIDPSNASLQLLCECQWMFTLNKQGGGSGRSALERLCWGSLSQGRVCHGLRGTVT